MNITEKIRELKISVALQRRTDQHPVYFFLEDSGVCSQSSQAEYLESLRKAMYERIDTLLIGPETHDSLPGASVVHKMVFSIADLSLSGRFTEEDIRASVAGRAANEICDKCIIWLGEIRYRTSSEFGYREYEFTLYNQHVHPIEMQF